MNDHNPNGPYGAADGIQIPSAATSKILLFRDEVQLATASGFLTESEDAWNLVTALHNFTGRDFFTNRCMSPNLATPNKFKASVRFKQQGGRFQLFGLAGNLFTNGTPVFLHDCSEEGGDIAVIKMPKEQGHPPLITMNDTDHVNWTAFAGLDVFALGFPSAINVNETPIWKKVSIASEPSQKVNGRRAVLIDGLTYKGMSGGPVIINQSLGYTDEKDFMINKQMSTRVLGVYGGRFDTDAEKSGMLGFYWPIETVNQIIANNRQVGAIDCE